MLWVAPTEEDIATDRLESRLWFEAGQPRANCILTVSFINLLFGKPSFCENIRMRTKVIS